MNIFFLLLLVNTLLLWFEAITCQELQDYRLMNSLTLTLRPPKEDIHFKPFFNAPQYQAIMHKPDQPQYKVKEYNEEYPIQQFQSIKDKYRIQPVFPLNQYTSTTYTSYKSNQSKPQNKKVALVKGYQNKKNIEKVHEQLAQPQFQSLQQIKRSPIQLSGPQMKYGNYHLRQQPLDIPEIQLPSIQVQQLHLPNKTHSLEGKSNKDNLVPSDELKAPSMEPWNSNNDSNLYYKVLSSLTKMETPINYYPRKYNPEVDEKVKPLLIKPKQQFGLLPVTTETMPKQEQKEKQKAQQNFEKPRNKKLIISNNKVQKTVQSKSIQNSNNGKEPIAEESTNGFSQGFDFNGEIHNTASLGTEYNSAENNSNEIKSPNGYHHNRRAPKDRVEFQMHGYDGPLSYKWGFDTGEGRNRHFRYEERDKLGHVKGHYGYYDKRGKLRMVHYNASPKEGFIAETENFGKVNTK